jgi:hypothetical protein
MWPTPDALNRASLDAGPASKHVRAAADLSTLATGSDNGEWSNERAVTNPSWQQSTGRAGASASADPTGVANHSTSLTLFDTPKAIVGLGQASGQAIQLSFA